MKLPSRAVRDVYKHVRMKQFLEGKNLSGLHGRFRAHGARSYLNPVKGVSRLIHREAIKPALKPFSRDVKRGAAFVKQHPLIPVVAGAAYLLHRLLVPADRERLDQSNVNAWIGAT